MVYLRRCLTFINPNNARKVPNVILYGFNIRGACLQALDIWLSEVHMQFRAMQHKVEFVLKYTKLLLRDLDKKTQQNKIPPDHCSGYLLEVYYGLIFAPIMRP